MLRTELQEDERITNRAHQGAPCAAFDRPQWRSAKGTDVMNIIETLEQEEIARLNKTIPEFAPGDTVIVNVNVVEGERKRVQAYEGVVIAKRNRGLNSAFTVRKISSGEGVERTFQTYSPLIASIEVKRRGDVRRAKLYYLRGRSGKSARIREKLAHSSDSAKCRITFPRIAARAGGTAGARQQRRPCGAAFSWASRIGFPGAREAVPGVTWPVLAAVCRIRRGSRNDCQSAASSHHSNGIIRPVSPQRMKATLYEALGILPTSSDEEVRAALRRLIRKYYAKTRDGQGNVEEALRFINHASRILSDPDRRERYDDELAVVTADDREDRAGRGQCRGRTTASRPRSALATGRSEMRARGSARNGTRRRRPRADVPASTTRGSPSASRRSAGRRS